MVTNDPLVVTNVVACAAIVLRLMMFRKPGGRHNPWFRGVFGSSHAQRAHLRTVNQRVMRSERRSATAGRRCVDILTNHVNTARLRLIRANSLNLPAPAGFLLSVTRRHYVRRNSQTYQ